MDVVGVHVVLRREHGGAPAQTGLGGSALAVRGINARNAQNAGAHASAPQVAHGALGIHAALGTGRAGCHGAGFSHQGARAVAIHPAGRGIHQRHRQAAQPQGPRQGHGARVAPPGGTATAFARRWCQVHHAGGQARKTAQRGSVVQVAHQRRHPLRAQAAHAFSLGGERQHTQALRPRASQQVARHALAHIAIAHDQQALAPKPGGQRAQPAGDRHGAHGVTSVLRNAARTGCKRRCTAPMRCHCATMARRLPWLWGAAGARCGHTRWQAVGLLRERSGSKGKIGAVRMKTT